MTDLLCSRSRRSWVYFGVLCIILVGAAYLLSTFTSAPSLIFQSARSGPRREYSMWPAYAPVLTNSAQFKRTCIPSNVFSIETLSVMARVWALNKTPACRTMLSRFTAIYSVETRYGTVKIPPTFVQKVKGWLGNKEELYSQLFNQELIHVVNQYTRETTIFNPLRDKRPVTKPKESEEDYLKRITNESAKTCDFCRYRDFTAEHSFGRVESALSFSASNIFKLDTLHAVITMKEHDPVNWSYEQYMDMMKLTMVWLEKAHKSDPSATFPSIIWDLLPKSGSSQIHPHNQVFLSPNRYHGMVESWRTAAEAYFRDTGSNYFSDLVSVYSALGLTVTYRSAVAMASLTPRKDNEVVIIAPEANEDFFQLIYYVLRAFMDDLKKYSFSLGGGFPTMDPNLAGKGKVPAFVRVITRGVMTEIRTDISALELFTSTNVNIDPYKVVTILQESVQKRAPRP